MQRVTNCILQNDNKVLLINKPRRGWWAAPGGKMEQGETIKESVVREFFEETGVYIKDPKLKGVFTFNIQENNLIISEWMMFTFYANKYEGNNYDTCDEGILEWHAIEDIPTLPMAKGDYHLIDFAIKGEGILMGSFTYTPDYELITYRVDPA